MIWRFSHRPKSAMLLVITSQFIFAQSNEEKKHIREFSQPILRDMCNKDEWDLNMWWLKEQNMRKLWWLDRKHDEKGNNAEEKEEEKGWESVCGIMIWRFSHRPKSAMLLVITSQFIFAQSNEEKKQIREFSQPILRGTGKVEWNMLSESSYAKRVGQECYLVTYGLWARWGA